MLNRRLTIAALALLTSCASESTEEAASFSSPVVGGTLVSGECSWPSTVQVDGVTGCTGTLIHPRIVTTAAHCVKSGASARVTFGGAGKARFNLTATCKAGATGESGVSTGRDWGYCVLPEDPRVKALPIIAPIVGCEAEKFLKSGGKAWIVGFGATGANGAGFGTLRQVEVKLNRVTDSVLDVGDAQVGACHGDSGGPLYVQLREGNHDYGWRLAGATSGPGGPCDCTCSSVYVNIGMHVAAIEKNEGIDVTPCTDASGAWDPGPECAAMQKDPASASGTFPSCALTRTMEAIETCGPNPGSGGGGGTAGSGGSAPIGGASVAGGAGNSAAGVGGAPGGGGGVPGGGNAGASYGGAGGNGGAAGNDAVPTAGALSAGTTSTLPSAGTSSAMAGQTSVAVAPSTDDSSSGCSCAVIGHESALSTKGRPLSALLMLGLALSFVSRRRRISRAVRLEPRARRAACS